MVSRLLCRTLRPAIDSLINRIEHACFWSDTPADPWFFVSDGLALNGEGMIWLAGDVLLYGF